ncbi:MAG TPA: M1 family metallopeptidase [Methanoregulaceae archaeon]|nr:M1 family metallopeptidase [Methanoregulaceae archaeon]HOP66681.1 M1 family metallopeptidase [Methanoregulaceae archaeon]HPJ74036.1 M1 family metallopeptidase [Methanoregulaceae archaeon]
MKERLFRYYREDFGTIPVRVIHMDLTFDVFDDHTKVLSYFHAESSETPLSELVLDAKGLEILSVECPGHECTYMYDPAGSRLTIRFPGPVPPFSRFVIHTETICRPTKNILEGLYYDETPPGAPPQQITQCQQWGFQRLVPCIDDMTAKCTYKTTIIADERYTHLITNGDVSSPRQPAGEGRVKITYENTLTPMAPYLFFLGCGTYDSYRRECEYPNGRRCLLELLVAPRSDPNPAESALDILNDAVLWVHLFCGPGRYDQGPEREGLYRLVEERDRLLKKNPGSPKLPAIRSDLATLIREITPGYAYTGSTYREIAMQNSDFGGMENVGNTTISANRIMPYSGMTDPSYEYLMRVKVHEFYHNLNGSEVTGWSPFEIWLNEAVTVHVEDQYHAFHLGDDYSRLQTVLSMLAPGYGTLDLDAGAASMPIEPAGFNDPNELITAITYKKAPEFVRMIETLMGKEAFVKGLDLYHRRYRHGNATREDWMRAMEEVSGQSLSPIAEGWLKQTCFPTLAVDAEYDHNRGVSILHLRQSGDRPEKRWIFPVRIALADASGRDIAEVLHLMEEEEETLEISSPTEPAFLSINRGFSFYGKVAFNPPIKALYLQARLDSDLVNRCLALMRILDLEKQKMLMDPSAVPEPECTSLWFDLFSDRELMMRAGAQFLTVFESVPDKRFAHRYRALYDVRERILKSIATRHATGLLEIYSSLDLSNARRGTLQEESIAIKQRQIKNTALAVLSRLDTPDIHQLIQDQFVSSVNATDRLVAFGLYMDSSAPGRQEMLDSFEQESEKNPVSWENFLSIIATNSSPAALDLIKRVERSDAFRIEQANDQRALYGRFAMNRKISLQTEEGRSFLQKTLLRLAGVNEYSTVSMLKVFGPLDEMEEEDRVPVAGILVRLLSDLDPEKTPSVYNTAHRILAGAPRAVSEYEREMGEIPGRN